MKKTEQGKLLKNIRQSLDKKGFSNFFINVRTDTYLKLFNPLEETRKRVNYYEQAGTDRIFIPGLNNILEIRLIIESLNIPLNKKSTKVLYSHPLIHNNTFKN
ncbi:isocitrate lyase/phosphoenolpyruvate mutase family protein [uncultured Apibacter sp.]|uniref:isocitrate lyase/phosphoenolpyruvate mutase family protein n=1 Tax=uncultured Apibacter sp. TaxID=1778616 RepID=UPI0034567186